MGNDGGADQPPEGGDAPEGYEDLVRIDQGGFAIVYRARDTRFDRTVALKVLRSDSLNDRQLRRFRAECLAPQASDERAQQVTHRRDIRGSEPPVQAAGPAPLVAAPASAAPVAAEPPMITRRRLLIFGGALVVLLAAFTAWGLGHRGSETDPLPPITVAANAAPAANKYTPKNVVVTQGPDKGELLVSWAMPIRPDVVATVIYEGAGAAKVRAIVSYDSSPPVAPQATLHGLTSGRQVCLSAVHVVSIDNVITNAVDRPVCTMPR